MSRKQEVAQAMAAAQGIPKCQWSDEANGVGFIYFIHLSAIPAIKIGFSFDVARRLKTLQTASPEKLVLLGSVKGTEAGEHDLHRKFAPTRLSGEWFKDTARLRDHIAAAIGACT